MPKTKTNLAKKNSDIDPKEDLKEAPIMIDDEEKVIDPDLIAGEIEDDEDTDDIDALDDDEVDPFKDKWEE